MTTPLSELYLKATFHKQQSMRKEKLDAKVADLIRAAEKISAHTPNTCHWHCVEENKPCENQKVHLALQALREEIEGGDL